MRQGIELIMTEREEQISKHGKTVAMDVENNNEFQLTDAASALMIFTPNEMMGAFLQAQGDYPPIGWDSEIWKRMLKKSYKERLVIAGALIAAEIDRVNQVELDINGK